ncbi:hypothetical protein LCGC14_0712700 [marine sediment metagenome]|uniref:Terminase large subunit gp17-like C-terminal domain-containing protein n=1 Tax=marine sediment metagenome TaxID=412755 RepID=A0A0F9QJ41_9ZZZZ
METVAIKQINKVREILLGRFRNFCQTFIESEYYDDAFHGPLCDFLQDSGPDKLVVLPRTFLKTTVVSLYILWKAVKNPLLRALLTSNTTPNAQKTVRSIRSIVENNTDFQLFFPEVIPNFTKVRWSDTCACLQRKVDHPEGTFESAGVGANIIRRHFNIISEDDTVAPKKDELTGDEVMPSKDDIEKAVGFHKLTVPLLINEHDERIITATRWASYDLVNHVLENEKFAVFNQKAYLDEEQTKPRYRRFSVRRLENIRVSMGSYLFSMLYLNTPLSKEFMAFNPDWYKYYTDDALPEDGDTLVTLDPADPPTGKKSQDYSAIVSVKHTKKGLFVRRYRRKRLSDKQMISETFDVCKIDGAVKIRIEANRYAHLEAAFREEMKIRDEYYIVEMVKAKQIAKEARIKNRLSPLFENGVIWLKKGMRELEQELTTFPYGKWDDLIDALSWQVGSRTSTEYEKVEEKKPIPNRLSFTLEEIRQSCRGRHKAPYPFQKQMEEMIPG